MKKTKLNQPVTAYIALGGNLGDPPESFALALKILSAHPKIEEVKQSNLYLSAPLGTSEPQPDYINTVARLKTTLSAQALLQLLLSIETQLGRVRTHLKSPRTLDLDLLLYAEEEIKEEHLTVPHPRMHERAFVLLPLFDLAPDLHIPGHGMIHSLLPTLAGQPIRRF